jgi:hypothetical protein
VFLLGLGAQKAGTSWLHAQLNRRRDADFGFLKEYHIHDALTLPTAGFSGRRGRSLLKPRTWRRQRFLERPERYYAYFTSLLKHPGIRLTGDITPSYSGLSSNTLQAIQRGFAAQDIPVRPVFLMRDPIERIISSLRMHRRKQGLRDSAGEIQALHQLCHERPERINLRSDYGHTLTALQNSFGLKHCFIGTYEQLFHQDCWAELCRFLGVRYQEPKWEQRVNASRTDTDLPEELLKLLGQWQGPTLAAVQFHCPELDLNQLWPTASRWCSAR